MVVANNLNELLMSSSYLNYVLNECNKLAPEYLNMINYLPHTPPESVIGGGDNNNNTQSNHHTELSKQSFNYLIGRAVLTNHSYNKAKELETNGSLNTNNYNNLKKQQQNDPANEEDEDRAFKEIDDLYEYVRSGILPEYLKVDPNPPPSKGALAKHNNDVETEKDHSELFDVSAATNTRKTTAHHRHLNQPKNNTFENIPGNSSFRIKKEPINKVT